MKKLAMDSWARILKNEQEIPESFLASFKSIPYLNEFPYTVFAPPERWHFNKTSPKLLVLLEDRLYVAEKDKKQIQLDCFLFKDIAYIEKGTLLLHSWIKIYGKSNNIATTVIIPYNTVVEGLFRPITEKIRTAVYQLDSSAPAEKQLQFELDKFDSLIKTNYKYMNFGKSSLLPGQKVQQFILQPEICINVFKWFQRTIAITHLILLTDQELVLIQDDDSLKVRKQARYGGIWNYIPRSQIAQVTIQEDLKYGVVEVNIQLADGASFKSLYSSAQRGNLETFLQSMNQNTFQTVSA